MVNKKKSQRLTTTFLNKTESARRAGYKCKTEDCLRHLGCRNFTKVSDKINQWFDEVGLSENTLKIKLLSLLNAKKTKYFQHEGIVTDQREVEAIETQRRTLNMALKIRGMYVPEKYDHSGNLTIEIVKFGENKPRIPKGKA
jgi:phage terminase small subunit